MLCEKLRIFHHTLIQTLESIHFHRENAPQHKCFCDATASEMTATTNCRWFDVEKLLCGWHVCARESSLKSTKNETAEMESICKRNRKFQMNNNKFFAMFDLFEIGFPVISVVLLIFDHCWRNEWRKTRMWERKEPLNKIMSRKLQFQHNLHK